MLMQLIYNYYNLFFMSNFEDMKNENYLPFP